MNETEELIKAALTKHVEGTPHPGPILTALSRRRRRVRPTLIAIIAATVVAAGIAIPVAIQKPQASTPPATQSPMPVDQPGIKMRYGLKPLPGYVEVNRTAGTDGTQQTRVWMKNTCQADTTGTQCAQSLSLVMYTAGHPYWAETTTPKGEQVVVKGAAQAWVVAEPRQKMTKLVMRPAEPDTVLILSLYDGAGDTRQKALDVARTVNVDNTAVVQPALSFGWLPSELTRTSVTVVGSSPSAVDTWIDAEMADPRGADVQAKIVARTIDDPGNHMIGVTLPDGRRVQIQGSGNSPIALDKLRRIADNLKAEPAPDTSWVGK